MMLETTTKNGDKVMVHSMLKALYVSMDELTTLAQAINIKLKSKQDILPLNEANKLRDYVLLEQQKLSFVPSAWQSSATLDDYQNLIDFIDQTLTTIDEQMVKNEQLLKNSNQCYLTLQQMQVDDQHLLAIKVYLLAKFDFSLEELKEKLFFMKNQALTYLDDVDNSLSIFNDVQLARQSIDFPFTAKKIIRLYETQMAKITQFSSVDAFFKSILKQCQDLQQAQETFATSDKNKLEKHLNESYLSDHFNVVYVEWAKEIDRINQLYLQCLKACFIGQISEQTVIGLFAILHDIKVDLADFYLTLRSGFIIKYKENPKSDLLQEVVVKDRLFKIHTQSQAKFIKLLEAESSSVAYRFINQILSVLLNFKIEEKSEGYEFVYQSMVDLHASNLEMYLHDIEIYGRALEKKDLEISKLMFKMKQDLEGEVV